MNNDTAVNRAVSGLALLQLAKRRFLHYEDGGVKHQVNGPYKVTAARCFQEAALSSAGMKEPG